MTYIVTGANGFVASEVVSQLLTQGKRVVGTLRSPSRLHQLETLFPKQIESGQLEIAFCDLDKADDIDNLFKSHPNTTSLIHLASVLTLEGDRRKIVLDVVTTMERVFAAVLKHCTGLKQFVYSSSVAAMFSVENDKDPRYPYSPKDWSSMTLDSPLTTSYLGYSLSKKMAEKVGWDHVEKGLPFEFKAIILPTIFGRCLIPPTSPDSFNVSNEWIINRYTQNKEPPIVRPGGAAFASRRAIAAVHVQAADPERSPKGSKRYLVLNGVFSFPMMDNIMRKLYPDRAHLIPEHPEPQNFYRFDGSEAAADFDFPQDDLETCIKEVVEQYEEIKKKAQ